MRKNHQAAKILLCQNQIDLRIQCLEVNHLFINVKNKYIFFLNIGTNNYWFDAKVYHSLTKNECTSDLI